MNTRRPFAALLIGALALACSARPGAAVGTPPAATESAPPPPEPQALVEPPPPGIPPKAPFPPIARRALDNGFELRLIERHTHPIVEVTLLLRSGSATDGEKPGLATLSGELLKAGGAGAYGPRELVERAEGLGADLSITTDRDSTSISLGVTSSEVASAIDILADVALAPRFLPAEFGKLKLREIERVKSSARGNARWAAAMLLYRELYTLPTGVHPYSRYDATAGEIDKITLADCRAWHKTHFVPSNASLLVVGDTNLEQAAALVEKRFASWKGEPAPRPSISRPFPPSERRVFLADRPDSGQSQVYVGLLGLERKSPDFPAVAAVNQVLGGGVSGRLFLDVREQRSLAYNTGSFVGELAEGPMALVLSAGTRTPKVAETVTALLENLDRIVSRPPSQEELDRAARYLADGFVFQLETVGSVQSLLSELAVYGLDDDYFDEYREAIRALDTTRVSAAAERWYKATPVIVVAGDAKVLAAPLQGFGPVTVIDPEKDFAVVKALPKR